MLETIDLSKSYNGVTALERLTLSVKPREIVCLLGANGAGKTTTINLFLNFIQPSSGVAKVKNLDVVKYSLESKKYIAYIPEQVMLYPNLSGLENLEYFTKLSGHNSYSKEQLLDFLARAGLSKDISKNRISTYSKGMRQKVGIAIAIAKKAEALLLDEPTSGLDPKAANEFSQLLKQLGQNGAAILMATHDLFHAKETGTRVVIMKQGSVVEDLATSEITHNDLEKIYLQHMK